MTVPWMTGPGAAALVTAIVSSAAISRAGRSRSIRRRIDGLRPDNGDVGRPLARRGATDLRGRDRTRRFVAATTTTAITFVIVGPFATIVGLALLVAAKRASGLVAHRRTQAHIELSIPDAVEMFVLLAHAGLTPVQAVRQLSATAPESTRPGFAGVTHRLERGETFADALRALPERLGPSMIGLADLVASADRNGSPLAPTLESLAFEARAARRRRNEADARRLPIRLSFPLVVCTLPSFILLAIAPAVIAALTSISVPI